MSARWYDSDWPYRLAATVANSAGGTTVDGRIVVPATSRLWAELAADGDTNSIRVADADGVTLLSFELTDAAGTGSWSTANKDGAIRVDAIAMQAAEDAHLCWVYFGNRTASTGATTPTIASAELGTILEDRPNRANRRILRAKAQAVNAANPSDRITKSSAETVHVWVSLNGLLANGLAAYETKGGGESASGIQFTVETGGAAQASMVDDASLRFVEIGDELFARLTVKAGTSGTDYTGRLKVWTTQGQVLEYRFLVDVEDVDEQ